MQNMGEDAGGRSGEAAVAAHRHLLRSRVVVLRLDDRFLVVEEAPRSISRDGILILVLGAVEAIDRDWCASPPALRQLRGRCPVRATQQ